MKRFFTSWSGCKDCTLAHYLAQREGYEPKVLFSMCKENENMSRSHGLPKAFLEAQAASIGLPCVFGHASWGDYETSFINQLGIFKKEGIDYGVFGDMDLDAHRQWQEMVCGKVGMEEALMPLWLKGREANTREFIELGFKAIVTSIKLDVTGSQYLGEVLTHNIVDAMKADGIDPSGEGGEFHTAVIDGPLLKQQINMAIKDKIFGETHGFIQYKI